MNSSLNCYSIAPDLPFLDILAAWVMERFGQKGEPITDLLILLPNRRACRSLQESFLKLSGGKPLLLPRIQPIGDVENEWMLPLPSQTEPTPGAIDPLRRLLLLTQLVLDFERKRDGQAAQDLAQASELAWQLTQFLDEVAREGLSWDGLATLVPKDHELHWQQVLAFLQIVSLYWPKVLEEEQAQDPIAYRNQLFEHMIAMLAKKPPAYPIIAAGSTGSQPATASLLAAIARLPNGHVVLPALDQESPARQWEMISDTHPQYLLKRLLVRMGCERAQVQPITPRASNRMAALQALFQPADATAHWRELNVPLAEGLKNVSLLEADTQLEEARVIAIKLREIINTPKKTAALVTPDRGLARMVAAQLQRFGVTIDDSAGKALAASNGGCFLRLLAEMAASKAAPSSLLAVLRHPLTALGMDPAHCRSLSRRLELDQLRGIRKQQGLEHLKSKDAEVMNLLRRMQTAIEPFSRLFEQQSVPCKALLEAHLACAQACAATAEQSGEDRLWSTEAGRQLAGFLANLLQQAELLAPMDPFYYPGFLESLLKKQNYWPLYGQHPRLHILSPMEARLQSFDHVILAELNEGTWPAGASHDPWMSRPMRRDFGLPSPERAIGQSAHDVYMLCGAAEVTLTRARKIDGTPTVASRWWVRLETLLAGLQPAKLAQMKNQNAYYEAMRLVDQPIMLPPLTAPAPTPPLAARPRELNVTAIDQWLRDPYVIYARHILHLKKLKDLDQALTAADFGNVIHKALEQFVRAHPQHIPANALDALLSYGQQAFAPYMDRPAVACVWWPRFEAIAEWFIEQEMMRRTNVKATHAEVSGVWAIEQVGKRFTLNTRIDRLEIMPDGSAVIADYKTGSVPSQADLDHGRANQLLLESLVALKGQLDKHIQVSAIEGVEYWKLDGNVDHSEAKRMKLAEGWQEATSQRLLELIARFDDANTPYQAQTNPSLLLRYNDYEHLTRRKEWEEV
ncbi:MAG: double-strand break repair protein AddB [Rickettsiales bacterium]|nr:double-strand break repair protein AddB [Rickettsiales bacterium]